MRCPLADETAACSSSRCMKRASSKLGTVREPLVPDVRHLSAYHRAFEGDENRRCAGNGVALDVVETRSFLELLLYSIGDLLERVRDVGARPQDLDYHGLDRKVRVFVAAKSQIGQSAGRNDDHHQKPNERAVRERPF